MSALEDHLKRHRQQIIDREAAAFRQMLAAYEPIERDLKRAYRELQKKILDAQAAGEKISPSWFYRERRLQMLLEQVRQQIERFGRQAAPIVEREQRAAIRLAADHSSQVLSVLANGRADIGTVMSSRAVETAVGVMGDGTPLYDYYKERLAPAVVEKIKAEVIKAAAIGTDFNTIARRLAATGDITRARALSMARTEVNRVRRETTRAIYQENDDVVSGWEWVAAKSSRTCAVCLALDGKQFKLKDAFPQHINCRCTIIAVIIGLPRPKRELGREWFDRQPDDVKKKILGNDGLEAFKRGDLKLADLVGYANSKEFGLRVYRKPLAKVLADDTAKQGEKPLRLDGEAEIKAWTEKAAGKWATQLTADEDDALVQFMGSGYRGINAYLRGVEPADPDDRIDDSEARHLVSHIDSAIRKGRIPQDIVVHRGFGIEASERDGYAKGKTISNSGFFSTSLDTKIADKFARWAADEEKIPVRMELVLPKGTRAAFMDQVRDWMKESEVLLERNGKYSIVSVDERKGTLYIKAAWIKGSATKRGRTRNPGKGTA